MNWFLYLEISYSINCLLLENPPSYNCQFPFEFKIVPCKTATYDCNTLKMKQNPSNAWAKTLHNDSSSFTRNIWMYYTTTAISTFETDKLIDFSTFISAIGGNLGLFLGISFVGVLFSLYDWIQSKVSLFGRGNNAKKTLASGFANMIKFDNLIK